MTGSALFDAVPSCWVCGSCHLDRAGDVRFEFTAYRHQDPELDMYSGASVRLVRCRACGFGQPDRLPTLPRFFERMYNQHWSSDWIAREQAGEYKDRIFARVLDGLAQRLPVERRALLDVGSHAGRFLSVAAARGWRPQGLEVNERTARHAEHSTGLPVHRVPAHEVHTLPCRFDAVTLTDVLEHLPDPVEVLGRLRRVLRPNGWLAIKVPSGPAQRLKERARTWLAPDYHPRLADNLVHVSHFSPCSLRLALERSGFDSIHLEAAAPERAGSVPSNAARLALFGLARALPHGIHSPAALHLQAFARLPESRS